MDEPREKGRTNADMDMPEPPPSPSWRPYFDNSKTHRPSTQPRKRHTAGPNKPVNLKTITNEVDDHPTLLLATSITQRASEDSIDDTEDRPGTRVGESYTDGQSTVTPDSGLGSGAGESKPRHSFSFSDMLSSSPAWRLSRGDSLRKKKPDLNVSDTVRHVSSPIMSPPSRGSKGRSGGRLQRRRNITDPTVFKAPKVPPHLDLSSSIYAAKGESFTMKSPLPPLTGTSGFDIDLPGGTPTFPASPISDTRSFSHTLSHAISPPTIAPAVQTTHAAITRPKRYSQAGSDPASTLIGSDGETRVFTSGDEDSMDFQSDTAYDSLATRATVSSHSGLRGPRIETIFDESPPQASMKEKLVPLEDLIQGGSFSERFSTKSSRPSIMGDSEDEDNFSTPIKAPNNDPRDRRKLSHLADDFSDDGHYTSSPPPMPSIEFDKYGLRDEPALTDDEEDDPMEADNDMEWEIDEPDQVLELAPKLPTHTMRRISPLPFRSMKNRPEQDEQGQETHANKRSSIFEWSEQQKSDMELGNGSTRPKTVHGKQPKTGRGSRSAGRRGPSALHLRSQSVPVTRDPNVENGTSNGAGKFGTWGLGNKGVSEEWNDDFEFEEEIHDTPDVRDTDQSSIVGGKGGMKVPQSIIDRQASVHVQFGQVQELTLLVGELRRLRARASVLDLLEGPSSSLWKDADGIINLATVDDEDDPALPQSPISTTFGFDDSDDEANPAQRQQNNSPFAEGQSRRNSVLRRSTSSPATPPSGKPRGDGGSAAQAKSFLQTIYQHRVDTVSPHRGRRNAQDKMPFDTQDLRNLVTRAGVLTRALKEIIRKAEGVSHSPEGSPFIPRDPPFSQIFNPAMDRSPTSRNSLMLESDNPRKEKEESPSKKHTVPKSPGTSNNYLRGSMSPANENDIAGHMKLMTVA